MTSERYTAHCDKEGQWSRTWVSSETRVFRRNHQPIFPKWGPQHATWGVPNASEWGAESKVAHKWAGWLHGPCRLGGPQHFRAGGRIPTQIPALGVRSHPRVIVPAVPSFSYPPPPLVLPHPRKDGPLPPPEGRLPSDAPPPPPGGTALPPNAHIFTHRNCTAKRKNTMVGGPAVRSPPGQDMGIIVTLWVTGNPPPSSSGRWWGSARQALLFMACRFEGVCV